MTHTPWTLFALEASLVPGRSHPQAGRGQGAGIPFAGPGSANGKTFPLGADEALLRDIGATRSAIRSAVRGRP